MLCSSAPARVHHAQTISALTDSNKWLYNTQCITFFCIPIYPSNTPCPTHAGFFLLKRSTVWVWERYVLQLFEIAAPPWPRLRCSQTLSSCSEVWTDQPLSSLGTYSKLVITTSCATTWVLTRLPKPSCLQVPFFPGVSMCLLACSNSAFRCSLANCPGSSFLFTARASCKECVSKFLAPPSRLHLERNVSKSCPQSFPLRESSFAPLPRHKDENSCRTKILKDLQASEGAFRMFFSA